MLGPPDTSARPVPRVERWAALLLVVTVVHTYVAWGASGRFEWTVWADRDLVRSLGSWWALPTSGAELSFGGGARIPGGALHQAWWALLSAGLAPVDLWRVQLAVAVLTALALGAVLARRLGPLPAAVAVVVTLAHPLVLAQQLRLWNPAWSVGPATALAALVAAGPGRHRGAHALLLGAVVAVGAQAHLSLALVGAVVLADQLARGARRAPLLAGVVLPYVPFLLEQLRGSAALSALLSPGQLSTVAPGVSGAALWEAVVGVASLAGVGGVATGLWGASDVPRGVALGAFAIAASVAAARSRAGRAGLLLLTAVVLIYVAAPTLDVANLEYERFLVPLVPFVGVVLARGGERLLARHPRVPVALACALLGGWLVVSQRLDLRGRLDGPLDAARLTQTVAALDAELGRPWLGRVAFVFVPAAGAPAEALDLVQLGWFAPGAVTEERGPCAVVVEHPPDVRPDGPEVAAWLAPGAGEVGWAGTRAVDPRRTILRYTTPSARCVSTVSPRYVTTPEEEAASARFGADPGTVVVTRAGDTTSWWVVAPRFPGAGGGESWTALIRLTRQGEHVVAELHASALRGRAWNAGRWNSERVRRPRLVARGPSDETVLVWAPGRVGVFGVLTPLRVAGDLPEGAPLFLEYEVDEPQSGAVPPGAVGTTVSLPLDPGAPRPPG